MDDRKIHSGSVPRLGGVGFAAAFIIMAVVITYLNKTSVYGIRFIPVLAAMPLILIFGVVDDFRPLAPRLKLTVQCVAALFVLFGNYTFHRIDFPSLGIHFEFGLFRYPLTLVWIVGVTNAMNLIDGVDGLAGGVAALVSLSFAAVFFSVGNQGAALLCLTLAASIAGFLVFNLPLPQAKIFMGDGGSQFLGFILALLPLLDNGDNQANLPLPFAAALLLIPIFDTFAAIWRRTRDGRRIDSPDKAHMHHKLMNLGLRAKGVDAVVYMLQICLGVLVYFSFARHSGQDILSPLLLGIAYALGLLFFIILHYGNRNALHSVQAERGGTAE
jgi:UDP-GlcNAc:undecaprenyl-phosphate GlcNAc-1-phosphate transferase